MRIALVENGIVLNVAVADMVLPGWIECPDDVSPGWRLTDGEWAAPAVEPVTPDPVTILTPREFILRLGSDYAAIQRLRDTNAALPPDEKNYDLVRLFALWDAASFIDLTDADLVAAFGAFVGMGLITRERADEILGM